MIMTACICNLLTILSQMRLLRMHDKANVHVLARVSDVYSEDLTSVDLFVDPGELFNSENLKLERNWVATGTIRENRISSPRKRRKCYTPSISWTTSIPPGMQQGNPITQIGHKEGGAYKYRALKPGTFRLLYLLPGRVVDRLQGVIVHVDSHSAGSYRTLSYVWGTDQRTQQLMTPDGVIQITVSLEKALRSLRHQSEPAMLWVDAICINQDDNKEKTQQIRMLPKMFQTSASTYVFLEGDKRKEAAIEMLMQIRTKAVCEENSKSKKYDTEEADSESENDSEVQTDMGRGHNKNGRKRVDDWPDALPRVPTSWEDQAMPDLNEAIWACVQELFALPLFRRIWVIQEVVAATNVKIVCGKWIIDWTDLHLAIDIVDRQIQLSDDRFSNMALYWDPFMALAAQREWEARQHRWTLFMLLEHFRYAESTLTRDRLFALLGLASDGNEEAFEPDYESPLEDIVLRFARVFIQQGRGMQLLYRAGLSTNPQSHRFPSWIPDWTIRRPRSLNESSEGGVTFSASGPQQANISCIPDTDELLVEGYEVDVIERISMSSNVEQEWKNYFIEVDTMVDSAVLFPIRNSLEELKWRVPVAGVFYPKLAISEELDLESSYTAFRKYLDINNKGNERSTKENGYTLNGSSDPEEHASAPQETEAQTAKKKSTGYVSELRGTLEGFRFVVTKKGFLGVVPNLAQIGDMVALLKGGRVPFIFQRSTTRPECFRYVGESYMHGMMNGEGLSLPGVVEREFRLH